jgi:DNA-binding winged helix-turn-helix (wHTH) protein
MQIRSVSYQFGQFVLIPSENRLWHEGKAVHLPPKAFAVLVTLVSAGGHLVEKQDLMRAVWHDTHVEEANLAQTISVVRKALGAAPGGCLYVETVPKRGYRMAVGVKMFSDEVPPPPAAFLPAWSGRVKSVVGVGALVGAALACLFLYRSVVGH